MAPSQRVLGDGDHTQDDSSSGQAYSDNPYTSSAASNRPSGPSQIDTLNSSPSAHEPNERTSLLKSSSPQVRRKPTSINGSNRADLDPPSFHANGNGHAEAQDPNATVYDQRRIRKPWSLRLDFGIACLLLYVNFSFLLLEIVAITSPFIAHNALPPHRGSMFLPIWGSLLGMIANILSLVAFVHPGTAPIFAAYTNVVSAVFCTIILILCMAVTQLRRHEGILTLVVLLLAIASTLHAAYSAVLTSRYAPLLLAKGVSASHDDEPELGSYSFGRSVKRCCSGTWSFLHVSLPIVVLQVAIPAVFLLLLMSTVIQCIDASVQQPGQLWRVHPYVWSRQRFPEIGSGLWETGGREFQLHLSCRGVGIDDPVPPFAPETMVKPSQVHTNERKVVRRTVLVESDQGVSGRAGASWVYRMLKDGDLTSGDFETRVCFYDRPGYGFSDSAPSASTPLLVTALTQALTLAGEMARLETTPSFEAYGNSTVAMDDNMVPTPLARSGFVLVSRTYGALLSTLFATINPRVTHSALYLSPLPPALHFDHPSGWFKSVPAFFTRTLPALSSELGIWAMASVLRGRSRLSRIDSDERAGIRGQMERAWLQEEREREAGRDSLSWRAWDKKKGRYPERPTIVLSEDGGKHARGRRYSAQAWDDAQDRFVEEVVKGGLVHRDKHWAGTCEGDGYKLCRKALIELVTRD